MNAGESDDGSDSKAQVSLNEDQNEAKECSNCQLIMCEDSFESNQWKDSSRRRCKTCILEGLPIAPPKLQEPLRTEHGKILGLDSYEGSPLKASEISPRIHNTVVPKKKTQVKSVESDNDDTKVQNCPQNKTKECNYCKLALGEHSYSGRQWNLVSASTRGCITCISKKPNRNLEAQPKKPKGNEIDDETKKIMLKTRPLLIPESEKTIFHYIWPSSPISKREEKRIAGTLIRRGEYGPVDEEQKKAIIGHMKSTQMTLGQALSLRSILLQQKALYQNSKIQSSSEQLLQMYNSGHSVVDISKHFDFPPMNTFRSILSQAEWSKALIKKSFREPKEYFSDLEYKQFLAAEAADTVSRANNAQSLKDGEFFEGLLAAWFEQKGIRVVSQKELEKEQKKDFGTPVVTPDFLFLDHLLINGKRVAWMDCKAYYGADVGFSVKNLKKQIKRYIDHWGSGAVLYLHSFSENLHVKECLFLDANGALDIESISNLVNEDSLRVE